jgi:hypothetical protein
MISRGEWISLRSRVEVRSDLGSFFPGAAPCVQGTHELLASGTGSVEVFLRSLDLRRTAPPSVIS